MASRKRTSRTPCAGLESVAKRTLRVVLDTNVVVSALVFRAGRLAWLREAWSAGSVTPVVSRETVTELVRVLAYPKFRLEADEAKDLLALYLEHSEMLGDAHKAIRVPLCRDPSDRVFLRLAYASKVDALVSGDADLLAVGTRSRIPILTPEGLRERLRR